MAIEDDMVRSIDALNRNITKIFGGTDSFTGTKANPTGAAISNMSSFSRSIQGMTRSLKELQTSTDDFHRFSRRVAEFAGVGAIFDVIVDSGRNLVRSYTKLADVGQMFSGSMFSMAQAAGNSGLSLEEFTKALSRNSVAAAVLSGHSGDAAGAFMDIQKQVRQNLKDFGFYGMTLSQLTDATGDYIETLRLSGNLNKMNAQGQSKFVSDMLTSATGLAAAFGKSREEILKIAQEAMRNPLALAALTTPGAQQAAQGATQAFGGLDKTLADAFTQVIGSPLGVADINNIPFVKMLNSFGGQGLLQQFGGMAEMAKRGQQIPPEMLFGFARQFAQFYQQNRQFILTQQYGPNREAAIAMSQLGENLQGLVGTTKEYNDTLKRYYDALQQHQDPLTQAALLFESTFHTITGAFDEAFFKSFAQAIGGDNPDSMQSVIKSLTDSMMVLGKSLGGLFGTIFTPSNVASFAEGATQLVHFVSDVMPTLIDGLKMVFGWIRDAFGAAKSGFQHMGFSGGTSSLLALGLGWALKGLIGHVFRMTTQTAYISVRNGIWAGGKGLLGSLFGGAGGLGGMLRGVGGFLSRFAGRGLLFGLVAIVLDWVVGQFRGLLGQGLTNIIQDIINFGAGGAAFGSMFAGIGALPGAIVGGIVGLLVGLFNNTGIGSFIVGFAKDIYDFGGNLITGIVGSVVSVFKNIDIGGMLAGFAADISSFVSNLVHSLMNMIFDHLPTWLGGNPTTEPNTPQMSSPAKVRLENLQTHLQQLNTIKHIDEERGVETPNSVLKDISDTLAEIKEINKVQAAYTKKTADNTDDFAFSSQFAPGL